MANVGFILVSWQWQGFFCFQETSLNVDSCCGACSSQAFNHQGSSTHSSWRKIWNSSNKNFPGTWGKRQLYLLLLSVSEAGDDVWWKAWAWTSAVHEMQCGHVAPAFLLPSSSRVVWRQSVQSDTNPPAHANCSYPVPRARKHKTGKQQIPNIFYVFVNKAVKQPEKYS